MSQIDVVAPWASQWTDAYSQSFADVNVAPGGRIPRIAIDWADSSRRRWMLAARAGCSAALRDPHIPPPPSPGGEGGLIFTALITQVRAPLIPPPPSPGVRRGIDFCGVDHPGRPSTVRLRSRLRTSCPGLQLACGEPVEPGAPSARILLGVVCRLVRGCSRSGVQRRIPPRLART
jgi:hypothetical protein